MMMPGMRNDGRNWPTAVTVAAVYFVAAKLGLKLAFVNASATAVWPPTGISVAALLVLGLDLWLGVLVGAFLANLTTAGNVWTSLGIAGGNTLEAVAAAWLVSSRARGADCLERPFDVFSFALLAGLLSPALSATIGVASLSIGGFAPWPAFGKIWLTWWLGDAGGALLVAPLLIAWSRPGAGRRLAESPREAALVFLALIAVSWAAFGPAFASRPTGFLVMPALMWAAVRLGVPATALAVAAASAVGVTGTLLGYGAFARADPNESLLLLQGFLGVNATAALALAAAVSQLRAAERELRAAHGELERKVERRTAALAEQAKELSRSNAELEQYAYVVSHDLQEPVRKIAGFIDLWARAYRGRLDEKADVFVGQIVDAAERMSALIRDLLSYSRVGRGAPLSRVDASAAARAALDDLSSLVAKTGAVVALGDLPTVEANPIELRQVFENLLANALKFRGDKAPRVEVSCERTPGEWVFRVRDNGIGIEAVHHSRIFELFERLHPRHEYPGTGIGLALCKKIVERRGGRIWVESSPGEGSTFSFTVPA